MKVLCKKSYIIHSDGTEIYTKGIWYNVVHTDRFPNGKIIHAVENNLPLVFDDYYFALEPNENDGYKFKEYFFTRKIKLKKLNENIH